MTELTKRESSLAEFAASAYRRFYFRHAQIISWCGVALFTAGILSPHLGDWRETLVTTGFGLLMFGGLCQALSAAGKLYERVGELEARHSRAQSGTSP